MLQFYILNTGLVINMSPWTDALKRLPLFTIDILSIVFIFVDFCSLVEKYIKFFYDLFFSFLFLSDTPLAFCLDTHTTHTLYAMCACAPITKIIFFFSQGRVVIYFWNFQKKISSSSSSSSSSFFFFFFFLSFTLTSFFSLVPCYYEYDVNYATTMQEYAGPCLSIKKLKEKKKESPMKKVKNQYKTGDMYINIV